MNKFGSKLIMKVSINVISKFFSIRIFGDSFIIKFERTLKESSPPTRIPWKKSYGILKDPLRIFKDSLANLRIFEDYLNLQGISKDPYAKKLTDDCKKLKEQLYQFW